MVTSGRASPHRRARPQRQLPPSRWNVWRPLATPLCGFWQAMASPHAAKALLPVQSLQKGGYRTKILSTPFAPPPYLPHRSRRDPVRTGYQPGMAVAFAGAGTVPVPERAPDRPAPQAEGRVRKGSGEGPRLLRKPGAGRVRPQF